MLRPPLPMTRTFLTSTSWLAGCERLLGETKCLHCILSVFTVLSVLNAFAVLDVLNVFTVCGRVMAVEKDLEKGLVERSLSRDASDRPRALRAMEYQVDEMRMR